jgi:hypothetical protein
MCALFAEGMRFFVVDVSQWNLMKETKYHFRRCTKGLVLLVVGSILCSSRSWVDVSLRKEINIQTVDHGNMLSLFQYIPLLIEIDILLGM